MVSFVTDTDPVDDPLRPFRVPITEPLVRLTSATLTGVRDLLASTTATKPAAGCLWMQQAEQLGADDDAVAEHRRGVLALGISAANDVWQNALDLVAAIAHDVARTPPPVWSPLSLARGVLEAGLLCRYLMDPSISVQKRLARIAGVWRTDALYQHRTATAWGNPPAPGDGMLAYVEAAMVDCQITEWCNSAGKVVGYVVDGERAPLDMNITDEAAKALPPWMPEPYRLASGAAHSRPWVIGRGSIIAQERGTGEVYAGEAATVAASVMLVFAVLASAHEAWNAYFGLDRDSVTGQLQERLQAYLTGALFIAHPPDESARQA